MSSTIDYGNLMHAAMRGLIKRVLTDVAKNGLPGTHHFFITFDTHHPDAELADWLYDRYPGEMTVVMQHWYDKLFVGDDGFAVTLNFGDAPEPLFIPYDAIKTFVDPSVEFGLRFETQDDEEGASNATADIVPTVPASTMAVPATTPADPKDAKTGSKTTAKAAEKATEKAGGQDAEIVSLDSFRK